MTALDIEGGPLDNRAMAKTQFPSFPTCCQPVLDELAREGRSGARNCPKGHALSLEYARQIEAAAARKAAAEAA